MNLREFITLKRLISLDLHNVVIQEYGCLDISSWTYSPSKAQQLLNLYVLIEQYKLHLGANKNNTLYIKDYAFRGNVDLTTLYKNALSNIDDTTTKPLIYLQTYQEDSSSKAVSERIQKLKEAAVMGIPEKIYPVEEGNYFDVAYFKERSLNCAIFISVGGLDSEETFRKIVGALSEALIYQIVSFKGYEDENLIKELEETLNTSKGIITENIKKVAQDVISDTAKTISKDMYENNIKVTLERIRANQNALEKYTIAAQEAYNEKRAAEQSLEYLLKQESADFSGALAIISNFPEVISITTDGTNIIFDIVSQMAVDEALVNDRFIKDKNMLKFLEDVVKENIKLNFVSSISINPSEGFLNYNRSRAEQLKRDIGRYGNMFNLHHQNHSCFGSFKEAAKLAITAGNWIAVGLILIRAASDLNLADGAVYPRFIESIKQESVSFYYKDVLMDYSNYIRQKSNEERQQYANQTNGD